MTRPVFVYGTLLLPQVQERVCGRPFPSRPASLHGYRRGFVAGQSYPSLSPCPGASVEGLLLEEVDATSLERLDRYEGDRYERISVRTEGVEAWAWQLSTEWQRLVTGEPWCLDRFVEESLADFLEGYEGLA